MGFKTGFGDFDFTAAFPWLSIRDYTDRGSYAKPMQRKHHLIVMSALSVPMTAEQCTEYVAQTASVTPARARKLIEEGRASLAKGRLDSTAQRDAQVERLQRAMGAALKEKRFAAYAALESLLADVVGTKQPRRTEITGANGGSVEIKTWGDLAKLGEAALKERGK